MANLLLATPVISSEGTIRYLSGLLDWLTGKRDDTAQQTVGSLQYANGAETPLVVPTKGAITYNLQMPQMQPVQGLHIASHRPNVAYQQVTAIPTNAIGAQQAYQTYYQETLQRYQNAYTQFSPTYRMKESIISMATFGPGNEYVQRNASIAKQFVDFKNILSKILPPSIGFRDISVRISASY